MYKTIPNEASLTIVVPIYNEADSLQTFLPDLLEAREKNGWSVVFVNDGSTDDTAQHLAACMEQDFTQVITHKLNRGYGGALKTGILAAKTSHLVTIDSDGQHSVSDIEPLFRFAVEHDADMVVGDRSRAKGKTSFRDFGKWLIKGFTKLLMPLPINDLNSGFKLYRTNMAQKYIALCPNSMAFSDVITLAFINQRCLVLEYPISIQERKSGRSTISVQTALDTVMEIINLVLLFNPLRIFLPLSTICIVAGLGWGIPFMLLGRGVSVGAMLAIVTGLLFLILGLIASQLSAMRIGLIENTPPWDKSNE